MDRVKQSEKEAFLDGYRHGLGAAVRAVEAIAVQLPDLKSIDPSGHTTVRSVLLGIASGLRLLSASAVLADDECPNNG